MGSHIIHKGNQCIFHGTPVNVPFRHMIGSRHIHIIAVQLFFHSFLYKTRKRANMAEHNRHRRQDQMNDPILQCIRKHRCYTRRWQPSEHYRKQKDQNDAYQHTGDSIQCNTDDRNHSVYHGIRMQTRKKSDHNRQDNCQHKRRQK